MTNDYKITRTWYSGEWIKVRVGQRFFVGHCGSGRTVFGEMATLTKITEKHLVFTTDSGKKISTASDNLHKVAGKAGQQGNFVSTKTDRQFINSPLFVY